MTEEDYQETYPTQTYDVLLEKVREFKGDDLTIQYDMVKHIQENFPLEVEKIAEHLYNSIPSHKLSFPWGFKETKTVNEVGKMLHFDFVSYEKILDKYDETSCNNSINKVSEFILSQKDPELVINSFNYFSAKRKKEGLDYSPSKNFICGAGVIKATQEFNKSTNYSVGTAINDIAYHMEKDFGN